MSYLSVVLCGGLLSSTSFADVPYEGSHPMVVAPPGIDDVWTDKTKNDKFLAYGPMSSGGSDACFSIDDPIEGGPRRSGDKGTLLMPLTMVCVGLFASANELGWAGYEANGDHAKAVGNWPEAEKAYATAVGLLDRTFDKEVNQNLAALLNKLGAMRFKQNDFAGAEKVFRRALGIYTLTRGAEDLHVADTLDLIGSALFEQQEGRALAGPLFFRAWVVREARLGPEHPAVADSLHHMAVSLYSDNLSVAIPLFLRSKNIREKIFGHEHPLVAHSLDAMARLYEAHDRRDLAIPLYQDALTIQEKVFGPNASETLQARSHLDMAHRGKEVPH
jgi:tetratricopeptide (TPR) repeat protein